MSDNQKYKRPQVTSYTQNNQAPIVYADRVVAISFNNETARLELAVENVSDQKAEIKQVATLVLTGSGFFSLYDILEDFMKNPSLHKNYILDLDNKKQMFTKKFITAKKSEEK